ncbi:deoxyribose-phosphate aldolase [Psychroserpens burtonensis]|uniref:Deoxyribose-phosphate aldolase n=1 Tax=Psychroserpens burtonensis TaxID=49278 RepID=A0A5C7B898_9FLAO|nr:DUF6503 family protein [Psychroserpens burtonensis]TXE17475.1 deoxyribose-phosphate aldolase [Psychroserpens burtonensis]
MKYTILALGAFFLLNCKDVKQDVSAETQKVQSIIDKTIEVSGGNKFDKSAIEFTFRATKYTSIRDFDSRVLSRYMINENNDSVKDVLSSGEFQRFINDFPISVPDSMAVKYSASVNSVHYFAVLPYGLNDLAVKKTLLEDVLVKNNSYYAVKVTFNQDGGGEDFEDVFMYWVNKETNKVDYLAYSYNESDGKGIRFREAYNERYVNGLRFVDYNNYKPADSSISLISLPQLFEKGKLKMISKIELENIAVQLN